jgi:hypothetical protein
MSRRRTHILGSERPFAGAGRAAVAGLVALVLAGAPWSDPLADTVADELRLQSLQQRLDDLSRRVEQLESRASSGTSSPRIPSADGIQWTFDAALSQKPFNVTHQSFDRASGRFDLLLKVVAPISDPNAWQVAQGAPVPVVAVLTLADGTANESVVFHLARGPKLDAGAQLHLKAEIATEQSAAVRGVSVGVRETAR